MLKELMLPAEVKLLKPNPAGCWHCVAAMMHGLAALCGPSTLFRNGVPGPGKSVSETAEAGPASASIAAVVPIPTHANRILPNMIHSFASFKCQNTCRDGARFQDNNFWTRRAKCRTIGFVTLIGFVTPRV